MESVKKKLILLFAIFLIVAVIAYPVTDYIINDAIDRSLPHNVRNPGIEDNFDQFLVVFDGPFAVDDLDTDALLEDDNISILIYSPPVNLTDSGDAVYDVITSNTEKQSVADIISLYILGESDLNLRMVLDAVMQGGTAKLTLEDLSNTSEVIIFQTIPYDEDVIHTNAISDAGDAFENITGREPLFTVTHIEKDDKSGTSGPMVVYTKPLEVPLLKLKMSIIIAIIAVLPFLFYMAGTEVTKYVDTKKLNLKEKIPFNTKWLIVIVLVMFISFILGAIYSYFFMAPLFIQFLYISAAASGAQATYSIYEFVSFIAMLTLIFGFIFEFPLVIFILNRLGIVQKRMLTKYRRHAYVLFVILAAVITPPDVISQIIVAIPMIFFYELSVLIVKIFGRKDPQEGTSLI
ncbi:Sec-independent protein translocase protein TatC [Methanimicrococcus hongohii]|uniref:Sec-independent protein translocase protein TatC n=1 Tax=Methanimicrococcus hongohii TaxID=3028295 RepID=A0AA96V0U5_9EURY|nr:twin-arginine translocase subunit TatC [Methanimicrococcus sp. Hf6]WNY23190.1 Sec-independent protein translocase protein TatC [Methanimicrococcus sp. Hf6]